MHGEIKFLLLLEISSDTWSFRPRTEVNGGPEGGQDQGCDASNFPHYINGHGQKGVDGRSKWGLTWETEVRLWLDGVKVALGNRRMTVEAARKSGEPW